MQMDEQNEEITPENLASYQYVDSLVTALQSGDETKAQELLDAFEGYMVRFFQILRYGNFDNRDFRSRCFLALFIKSSFIRARVHSPNLPIAVNELDKTASLLSYQMSAYGSDEIWHELHIILLEMAYNYSSEDGKPRFHNYVSKTFHYILSKRIRELVRDPLVFSTEVIIQGSVRVYKDGSEESIIDQIPHEENCAWDLTDEEWISGERVSEEFSSLSGMERRLLMWRYEHKETYRTIGGRLGITWMEARKRIQDGVWKLRLLTNRGIETGFDVKICLNQDRD